MTEFKWTGVAHYYTNIPCLGEENTPFTALWFTPLSHRTNPTHAYWMGKDILGRDAAHLASPDLYKPILRHLDDMTEAEAAEFHQIVRGHEYFLSRHEFENGESATQNCLVWAKKFCKSGYFMPAEFHYLISKGFDVFGLIESGEAIRKGVGA